MSYYTITVLSDTESTNIEVEALDLESKVKFLKEEGYTFFVSNLIKTN